MMLAGGFLHLSPARAAAPEPLDTAFLDYLATLEGKSEDWTVVAGDKVRKKLPAPIAAKPQKPGKPAPETEQKP